MVTSSLAAAKRLRKELQLLQRQQQQASSKKGGSGNNEDDDIVLQHNPENLLLWKAWIRGRTCDYADERREVIRGNEDVLPYYFICHLTTETCIFFFCSPPPAAVDTPYEGGVFQLDIRCGTDYPLAPPTMKFVTKVRVYRRVS